MVLALAWLWLPGCNDDNSPNDIQDQLAFVRQDGSTMVMGSSLAICCGIWEPGFNDTPVLKIVYYDLTLAKSSWRLFIPFEAAVVGTTYSFPTGPENSVAMFMVDVGDGLSGGVVNELSSDQDDASGSITITSLECGPPLRISLTIDATITSEFHLAPHVTVSGSYSATVHFNPSPLGCDFSL